MPINFEVIELGTPESGDTLVLDPTDNNLVNEGASAFTGQTFGGPTQQSLFKSIFNATANDNGGIFPGAVDPNDFGGPNGETITIGGEDLIIDGVQEFTATITFDDDTPAATVTAVIFQTADGRTFLAPEATVAEDADDTAAFQSARIEAITFGAPSATPPGSIIVLAADRVDTDFVCFTRGVRIRTVKGELPVENIAVGDLVETLDHGPRRVRWVGSSTTHVNRNTAPIRFKAGAIGNARDLVVSPQHRMLITGWRAEIMFDQTEVLAKAKDLVNGDTIYQDTGHQDAGAKTVEYFHILFDDHEIIFAEGAPTESLNPGKTALDAMAKEAAEELLALFPHLIEADGLGPDARLSLKAYEVQSLMRC